MRQISRAVHHAPSLQRGFRYAIEQKEFLKWRFKLKRTYSAQHWMSKIAESVRCQDVGLV